ncbi:MAG: hypothetical protein PHW63_10380 [Alphaproteobacteria bacterium]|nr:hypothetical protein [Alphaproteobacteria bacterium]
MDTTAQILSALIGAGIVIMIAPRVLASNRGVALRNIAIWAALFLLLALAYTQFGPHEQAAVTTNSTAPSAAPDSTNNDSVGDVDLPPDNGADIKDDEEFSPPNEE